MPGNTHAWRRPTQSDYGFMCAKILLFVQKLGDGRYSVVSKTYEFFVTKAANRGASCGNRYSTCMINECKKVGDTATVGSAKPICEDPPYCRNDASAYLIGQSSHLAYKPYRRISS